MAKLSLVEKITICKECGDNTEVQGSYLNSCNECGLDICPECTSMFDDEIVCSECIETLQDEEKPDV